MGGSRRLGLALAWVGAVGLYARDVSADADARRIVPMLRDARRPPRSHPLSDPSGLVPLLVRVPEGQDPRALGLLPLGPSLGTLRLAPESVAAYALAHPAFEVTATPARSLQLDYSGTTWTRAVPFRAATGLDGRGVVVGILDTGVDVTHPDFRDANGKTRIAWLLRREAPRGKHPELEARFGCTSPDQAPCAVYDSADIDAAIANGNAPGDTNGHGTHVAAIAAGNGGPSVTPVPTYVGVAPAATLVVAAPSDAGFSDPDILNAARFIFDRADAMNMPCVLNASLGSEFGPHDGTSELEKSLAAFVGETQPGHAVVVAAGNEGELYASSSGEGPYGIHTEVFVSPYGETRVPVRMPGAHGTVTGAGFIWLTFEPGDDIEVALDGPGSTSIPFIAAGDDRGDHDDAVRIGVINSQSGAGRIPEGSRGAIVTFSGSWDADDSIAVVLRGRGHARLWLTGTGGAALGNGLGVVFPRARKSGTVAVPASHPELLAVGATVNRRAWPMVEGGVLVLADMVLDDVASFSAAGPTPAGAMKPELVAPGMNIVSAMSRDVDPRTTTAPMFRAPQCPTGSTVCYLADERHAVSSGTSMAAPQVAGAVALLFQRDPTLTQRAVTRLLQGSAARPEGAAPFTLAAGPGRLDLGRILELLDGRVLPEVPDAAASWFNLAATYLRSDSLSPVDVLVQLRDADGHVVDDVAEGVVVARVEGASHTRPLERVAAGLWGFAVAAAPNTAGTSARVEVLVGGKSLGVRSLPIAADPWLASQRVAAAGGCSVGEAGSRAATDATFGLALAAFVYARRRRR